MAIRKKAGTINQFCVKAEHSFDTWTFQSQNSQTLCVCTFISCCRYICKTFVAKKYFFKLLFFFFNKYTSGVIFKLKQCFLHYEFRRFYLSADNSFCSFSLLIYVCVCVTKCVCVCYQVWLCVNYVI